MAKKQGGKQVISSVGGLKLPTVDIFIAGYQDGAKACNPGIQVLVKRILGVVVAGRLAHPLPIAARTSSDVTTKNEPRVAMTPPFDLLLSARCNA